MQINKTYNSIRVFFDLSNTDLYPQVYSNEYLQYTVMLFSEGQGIGINRKTVYRGRTFVGGDKTTFIDLTQLVNSLIYRVGISYNYEQQINQPDNTVQIPFQRQSTEALYGNIVNTYLQIELYSMNALENDLIESRRIPVSIYQDTTEIPYQISYTPSVYLYGGNSVLVNHLPLIKTNNYWVGLNYCNYNVSPIIISTHTNEIQLPKIKGNINTSISLNNLFTELENASNQLTIYNGGNASLLVENTLNGGNSTADYTEIPTIKAFEISEGYFENNDEILFGYNNDFQTIAVLDACPSEWYVSWNNCFGWVSQPLDKVIINKDVEKVKVLNVYNEYTALESTVQKTFECYSNRLTNEQYEAFTHILETPFVILYNSKEDKSIFCNIDTSSSSYIHKNGYKQFTFNLSEIIKHNY